MAVPYNPEDDMIKIAMSTSSLFDMSEADAIFRAENAGRVRLGSYRTYMMSKLDEPLLIRNDMVDMLRSKLDSGAYSFTLMSKNSGLCGMRAIKTLFNENIIPRQIALTNGGSVAEYAKIYGADIFITTDKEDAEKADQLGVASAYYDHVQPISQNKAQKIIMNLRDSGLQTEFEKNAAFLKAIRGNDRTKVVYSFDFDKVLGGPESDDYYVNANRDLKAYFAHEHKKYEEAMEKAPWFNVYEKIMRNFQDTHITHICTARSSVAAMRMLNTLAQWGIEPNGEIHCVSSSLDKTPVLQELELRNKGVTFLDDGQKNVDRARKGGIRTGHVPSKSTSNLVP